MLNNISFKKTLAIAGPVMLAGLLIAGRRKPVNTELEEKKFSENLDQDLHQAESQFNDLIPNTEKKIIWADSSQTQTDLSIVYIHGFSASRQETAPLSDMLAKKWGANLFYTRLSGHGRSSEAMAEPVVNNWLNDADEAMEVGRRLGKKVVLIGTSTGGTLATWLATRPELAEHIAAVVLISPNYWVRASGAGAMLWPWGKQIIQFIQGDTYEWQPVNEEHGTYWTTSYPSVALVEMMKLLDHVNSQDFGKINVPALFVYSPNDQVVDPVEIEAAFERFGSEVKHLEAIEETEDRNNHVIAGDILSPQSTAPIMQTIDQFLEELDLIPQREAQLVD